MGKGSLVLVDPRRSVAPRAPIHSDRRAVGVRHRAWRSRVWRSMLRKTVDPEALFAGRDQGSSRIEHQMASPGSFSVITDSHSWLIQLQRSGLRDPYLLPQWSRSATEFDGGSPTLVAWEDPGGSVLLPLLIKEVGGSDAFDATTPYGYGGPICSGSPDREAFRRALGHFAAQKRLVTLFCRLHPLLDASSALPEQSTISRRGNTIAWRIGEIDDLFGHLHKKHRYCASRCRRDGMQVKHCSGTRELGRFRSLYSITMVRKGAEQRYHFSDAYWEHLGRGKLGDTIHQFDVLDPEGALCASALLLCSGEHVHYHLSASSDRGRKHGATVLLLLEAAIWAKRQGYRLFHLGGGLGAREDDLYKFKHRFDKDGAVPFSTANVVFDQDRYAALCRHLGYWPVPSSEKGYFPCWRDPERSPSLDLAPGDSPDRPRQIAHVSQ